MDNILKKIYSKLPSGCKKAYRYIRNKDKGQTDETLKPSQTPQQPQTSGAQKKGFSLADKLEYASAFDSHEALRKILSETKAADLSSFHTDNSNFFHEDQEFFFIESNNLKEIKSHFYGFSLQPTGIYENANITEEALRGLNGRGIYVSVEASEKQIQIRQDYNGSYGLFLYQADGYFAISNSFFYLLEHLKNKVSLSLNEDFAAELLTQLTVVTPGLETAVKEIQMLDRALEVTIDKQSGELKTQRIDYQVATLSLDTEEGIRTLDRWFSMWTRILEGIVEKSEYLSVDLSGGFDSRMTFLLLLQSNVDLNRVRIRSLTDGKHTHNEDYQIASSIAEHFGFKLNRNVESQTIHYSLCDALKISHYVKMTFHKQLYHKRFRNVEKHFSMTGAAGGTMRTFWYEPPAKNMLREIRRAEVFTEKIGKPLAEGKERILKRTFQATREKYGIEDLQSKYIPAFTYREGRCRHHFGKSAVIDWFCNSCTITPMLDPDLGKLQLFTSDCKDANLLSTIIFDRYCPDLLEFPFQGNREIKPGTIAAAKAINEKFPFKKEASNQGAGKDFAFCSIDEETLKICTEEKDNTDFGATAGDEFIKALFLSEESREIFTTYYDEEVYCHALEYSKDHDYHPLSYCNGILGLTAVLYDIHTPESKAIDRVSELLQ